MMIELGIFLGLLTLGYGVGTAVERSHFKSLRQREEELNSIPWANLGRKSDWSGCQDSKFVSGSVVIAQDYFKGFLAGLISLTGGRLGVYESLLDRGRREALCRLKEEAKNWGCDYIANIRFETSNIGMNKQGKATGSIEVLAYGTAIKK